MEAFVERLGAIAATPADRVRSALLRAGGAPVRSIVRDRTVRVALGGTLAVTVAFALASSVPLVLLLLGPVVLGVPHLAADIRYAVLRVGLHRVSWIWLAMPLFVGAVVLSSPPLGMAAAAVAALGTPGLWWRRAAIASVFAAVGAWLAQLEFDGLLVVAHGHNFVAVLLWTMWWRDRSLLRLLPIATLVLCTVAIAFGVADAVLTAPFLPSLGGVSLESFGASLAPSVAEPWAGRLVLSFAMAQSVHYAIWLRLVPDDDRTRSTPRTFASSWRAFVADLGAIGAIATVVLSVAVVSWAIFDLVGARDGYLRLAAFHGYIEFVALAVLAVRPLRGASSTP